MALGKITEQFPEISAEWLTEKNHISIEQITAGSQHKVWWECSTCSHHWKASVANRCHGTGCPKCSGRHGTPLLKKAPHLAKEWIKEKNNKPIEEITSGSGYKAWWQCKTCSHQWQAHVQARVKGNGCRPCGNASKKKQPLLIHDYKTLCEEWLDDKNDRSIETITAGSQYKAWWQCGKCSNQWESVISTRTKGSGCPKCAGKYRISLIGNFSQLAKEWIREKNKKIIEKITTGSVYKAWWKCPKCSNQWRAKVEKRVKGSGCPHCSGKQRTLPF